MVTVPGGVFALWGKPTVEDMDRVVETIEGAARTCGHPVVYVTRVPAQAPAPDAAARARIDRLMPRLKEATSGYHVVLEGEGFGAAVKRGVLTGIFQLSRHSTFFVHATVNEVLRRVPSTEQKTTTALLAAAAKRGLLTSTL
jgi:hypothetical protein